MTSSHLRSQIRTSSSRSGRSGTDRGVTSPPSPPQSSLPSFTLPRHAATRLFQMKIAVSYLLVHPIWHRPNPGLCPRCEEIETTEHALLRCLARQYAVIHSVVSLDLASVATLIMCERDVSAAYPSGMASPGSSPVAALFAYLSATSLPVAPLCAKDPPDGDAVVVGDDA